MKTFIGFATIWHKEGNPYDVSSYEYSVVAENEERAKEMITDRINEYKQAKLVVKVEEVPIDEGEQLREVVSESYKGVIVEQALKEAMGLEAQKEEEIKNESSGWVSTDLKHLLLNPLLFHSFITKKLGKTCKVFISDGQLRVYSFGGLTIDEERKTNVARSRLERRIRALKRAVEIKELELKEYFS